MMDFATLLLTHKGAGVGDWNPTMWKICSQITVTDPFFTILVLCVTMHFWPKKYGSNLESCKFGRIVHLRSALGHGHKDLGERRSRVAGWSNKHKATITVIPQIPSFGKVLGLVCYSCKPANTLVLLLTRKIWIRKKNCVVLSWYWHFKDLRRTNA